jgi:hypothetical protein
MYCYPRPWVPGQASLPNASEAGITIRPVSGPAIAYGSAPSVFVYFWALQVDIRKSDGTVMGGGHFGVQWCNPLDASQGSGHYGRINWGCYDGFYTPDPNAVCRSSKFLAPFDQYGNFRWEYGDIMKFRVFKSPKQNWLAATCPSRPTTFHTRAILRSQGRSLKAVSSLLRQVSTSLVQRT